MLVVCRHTHHDQNHASSLREADRAAREAEQLLQDIGLLEAYDAWSQTYVHPALITHDEQLQRHRSDENTLTWEV